jgi:hypothetical protein
MLSSVELSVMRMRGIQTITPHDDDDDDDDYGDDDRQEEHGGGPHDVCTAGDKSIELGYGFGGDKGADASAAGEQQAAMGGARLGARLVEQCGRTGGAGF